MEPPVREVLNSHPKIKRIKFDLLNDLPCYVGSRFEDEKKPQIYFRDSDDEKILQAIHYHIKEAGEPKNTVYDIHVIGIMPTELGARMAANLRLWDNVKALSYATPRKNETLIFDTEPIGNTLFY